jgi:hypothetical protein
MSEAFPGMTIGQILDRVFRLTRAYWRLFAGIAAVPAAAVMAPSCAVMAWWMITIIRLATTQPTMPPHIPVYFAFLFILVDLIPIPVFALYVPAGIYAAVQANLGMKVTFRQAYAEAWRRYGRYLWLMVLIFLYIAGPLMVLAVLIGGGAFLITHGAQPGSAPAALFLLIPAAILAYLGFFVYCILIMLRFAVAFPAAVAEGLSARAALRRSTTLTCGARGRIFLVMLVVYAAMYVASMAIMIAFTVMGSVGALAAMAAHVTVGSAAFYLLIALAAVIYLLLMVVYAAFTYAAMNAALAVIYHDQRWRKDGVAPWALPA